MREILFRGKESRENGGFVEGAYYHQTEFYGHKEFNKRIKVDEHYIITSTDELEDNMMTFSAVFPETIGQYTGLTDKNGKKIFEGDILKGYVYPFFNEEKDEFNYFAEVVWFENSPAFGCVTHKNPLSKVNGISSGNTDYLEDFYSNCWEIIGNIHDNPELLRSDN